MVSVGVMDGFADGGGAWLAPPAVDASPKRFGLLRALLPYLSASAGLARALWPVSVPVLAAPVLVVLGAIVGVELVPVSMLVILPVVAVVASPLLALVWPTYRAWLTAGLLACHGVVWRFRWPALCSLCGIVGPGAGRARVPRLLGVTVGPSWWRPEWVRLDVVPLAQHDRPTWGRYEDRIARQAGFRFGSWIPSEAHGGIEITVLRKPLPTRIEVGVDVPVSAIGRQVPSGHGVRDEVLVGWAARGGEVVWRPDESGRSHLFIAGRTGGGKGASSSTVLGHGARVGWRIFIANPKRSGEFRWLGSSASVAKTPAGMFNMLAFVRIEMERRADVLDEVFGVASWDLVPASERARHGMDARVLLFIDEIVRFTNLRGVVPPPPAPEGHKGRWTPMDPYTVAMNDLQAIASMGRALGVSLVVNTQHPISEHLGTFGSTIKSNFGAKLVTGAVEPEGAAALFGKGNGEAVAELLRAGIPGRMVYQGLATADGGQWQLGQGLYLPEDPTWRTRELVPAVAAHRPVVFDLRQGDGDVIDINETDKEGASL